MNSKVKDKVEQTLFRLENTDHGSVFRFVRTP